MKKALLIGINYYDNSGITLNGCINDIISINHMLIDAYDYTMDNITMLRDDVEDPVYRPTKENIVRSLKTIIDESVNLEEIWIHYSGHGSRIFGQSRNRDDGYDEVLVPIDYETNGFILDDELFDMIKNIKPKAKAIIVMDCCHSATMVDLPWSFEYDVITKMTKKIKNNTEVLANSRIFMFSGCKDKETSADMFNRDTEQYSGAFTTAFLYCLRKRRHNVSYLQLYEDIFEYLFEGGYSQKPVFSCSTENPDGILLRFVEPGENKEKSPNVRSILIKNMRSIIVRK